MGHSEFVSSGLQKNLNLVTLNIYENAFHCKKKKYTYIIPLKYIYIFLRLMFIMTFIFFTLHFRVGMIIKSFKISILCSPRMHLYILIFFKTILCNIIYI